MRELLPGVRTWSVFSQEKGYDFNGWHLDLGGARVLVDPVPFNPQVAAAIERAGRPDLILVTNKDHRRAAPEARERWGAPILAHALDAPLLGAPVDRTFADGELLAGALRVVHIPDLKSPGECALHWEARRILLLGDALVGDPPGRLRMLPAAKFADLAAAQRSLIARLGALPVEALLLGDGASIAAGAEPVLREALAGLAPAR